MPFFVKLPDHPGEVVPAERYLNIINGAATAGQRQLRRSGYGGYEVDAASAMCAIFDRLGDSFTFFDVGANVGHYSFLSQGLWPKSKVVAFEPSVHTHSWLSRIAKMNGLDIRAENLAVGGEEGEVTFYLSSKSDASNSLNPEFRAHAGEEVVRCVTMDGFCEANDLAPDVLKIDTETVEEAVLRGSEKLLRDRHPFVLVEVLPSAADGTDERITKLVHDIGGYRIYCVTTGDAFAPAQEIVADKRTPDWLLSPVELHADFFESLNAWRGRLRECTKETNLGPAAQRDVSKEATTVFEFANNARRAGDLKTAAAGFRQAATMGVPKAHYWMGRAAENKKDFQTALRHYREGAAHGEPAATRGVARASQLGRGVQVDLREARRWLNIAEALGDATAVQELADLDRVEGKTSTQG